MGVPYTPQSTTYTPGGIATIASATMTRPANTTTYAAGDLVANSTTAGSVTGLVFSNAVRLNENYRIEGLRLRKSDPSLTNASFRIYICRALPTLSVGDNGVFNSSGVLAIDSIQHVIEWVDVTMTRSATSGAFGRGTPSNSGVVSLSPVDPSTKLIGLIEATAAYTPASGETFNCILEGQWS